MINEAEREKAIKHLTDARNSVILAEQAVIKSGITFVFNESNETALAGKVLKWAIKQVQTK
jgi:hypothetical protein